AEHMGDWYQTSDTPRKTTRRVRGLLFNEESRFSGRTDGPGADATRKDHLLPVPPRGARRLRAQRAGRRCGARPGGLAQPRVLVRRGDARRLAARRGPVAPALRPVVRRR